MMMTVGIMRLKENMEMTKEKPSCFICPQAREQDRPKGSGPYRPQPRMGNSAQIRAYSQIHMHSIFTIFQLIFSPAERKRKVGCLPVSFVVKVKALCAVAYGQMVLYECTYVKQLTEEKSCIYASHILLM